MRWEPRLVVSVLLPASLFAADRPDLIVTGAGIAGLSAALEGARAGLKVTVVEQNSMFGGHAVISSGGVCMVGTPLQERLKIADSPALAERDFTTWGEDPDPAWVRYYTQNSRTQLYDWLTALGTEFLTINRGVGGNSADRFHMPRDQGLGLVIPIYNEILRLGSVTFLYNTRVTGLRVDGRKVTGVSVENLRTGIKGWLEGGAVLLSTGGFGANMDLVRASWPPHMKVPERVLVGAGFFATGGGMDLAKSAGGASGRLDHQWNYATGLPDPFDPEGKRGFYSQAPGAIWVNAQAKRFVLEQTEPKSTVPAIAAQKPARFWAIFDAEGQKTFRIVHAGYTQDRVDALFRVPGLIQQAGTLDELARAAGLPPDALKASVDRYNRQVDAGDDADFHRFGPGSPPPRGSAPAARTRIEKPPYYAAPLYILIRKSLGGITVDSSCRVLNDAGKPVTGLLAAGEATGFGGINGRHGLEGTFLGPSMLMGRVAGRTVAAEVHPKPPAPVTSKLRTAPPPVNPDLASSCKGCHDLQKLVAQKRSGYWHFEHSHALVMARNLNCVGCHAEMAPFRAASHKIDRQLQVGVCRNCHVNAPAAGQAVAAQE